MSKYSFFKHFNNSDCFHNSKNPMLFLSISTVAVVFCKEDGYGHLSLMLSVPYSNPSFFFDYSGGFSPSYGGGYGSSSPSYSPSYKGFSHGSSPSYNSGSHSSSPSYSPSYSGGSHGSSPSYNGGSHGPSSNYDDEEDGGPKVITTTKTVTTSSAQDTGIDKLREQGYDYRQPSDSLGDIKFKLGDYLKDAPGHEGSHNFAKKYFQGRLSRLSILTNSK